MDRFWAWVQTTPPAHDAPIDREAIAAIRLVAQHDPYDVTIALLPLVQEAI
ncbi:hypothetical protein GALL_471430 [mine drainage metagenome]|uniref:Uncharacterized protein n=1 Tax=mine drainage metagenome TaxID=410659 RepID=A0A1J5PU25_9ZZZZ